MSTTNSSTSILLKLEKATATSNDTMSLKLVGETSTVVKTAFGTMEETSKVTYYMFVNPTDAPDVGTEDKLDIALFDVQYRLGEIVIGDDNVPFCPKLKTLRAKGYFTPSKPNRQLVSDAIRDCSEQDAIKLAKVRADKAAFLAACKTLAAG